MRIFREKRLVRMAFPGRIFTRLKELDDGLGSDTVGIEASRKEPAASATLRIPTDIGHRFRFKSDTCSNPYRTPIPIDIGQ